MKVNKGMEAQESENLKHKETAPGGSRTLKTFLGLGPAHRVMGLAPSEDRTEKEYERPMVESVLPSSHPAHTRV